MDFEEDGFLNSLELCEKLRSVYSTWWRSRHILESSAIFTICRGRFLLLIGDIPVISLTRRLLCRPPGDKFLFILSNTEDEVTIEDELECSQHNPTANYLLNTMSF